MPSSDYLNESARFSSTLLVTFVNVATYFLVTSLSVDDVTLLLGGNLHLPLLSIQVPAYRFFQIAPVGLVALHVNLLLSRHFLAEKLLALRPHYGYYGLVSEVSIWPLSLQSLLLGELSERVRWIAFVSYCVAFYALPVYTLLLLQASFIPYHSEWITRSHQLLLTLDIALAWLIAYSETHRFLRSQTHTTGSPWPSRIGVALALAGTLYALHLSYCYLDTPEECGEPARSDFLHLIPPVSKYLDVSGEVLSRIPPSQSAPYSFRGPDLSRRNLQCANFSGSDLQGVDLRGADLTGAILDGANLQYSDFLPPELLPIRNYRVDAASLEPDLRESDFESLTRTNLTASSLRGTLLHGASLFFVTLKNADLTRAQLRETWIIHSDLSNSTLRSAVLEESSFGASSLSGASLESVTGHTVSFREANLDGASLHGVELRDSDFGEASLRTAGFYDATLYEADFHGARFFDVDFRKATLKNVRGFDLQQVDLRNAKVTIECEKEEALYSQNVDLVGASLLYSPDGAACRLKPPTDCDDMYQRNIRAADTITRLKFDSWLSCPLSREDFLKKIYASWPGGLHQTTDYHMMLGFLRRAKGVLVGPRLKEYDVIYQSFSGSGLEERWRVTEEELCPHGSRGQGICRRQARLSRDEP